MKIKSFSRKNSGTTFVELLLYIAVFLVLMPILLTVSINSIRMEKQHTEESQISADSRFVVERVYDIIVDAKKVDVADSVLNDENGRLSLVMQDDSSVAIELNPDTNKIEITESGVTSALSSGMAKVERLYFERITDALNDPDIILGINVRLQMSGLEEYDVPQDYVVSANLERGDFDEDGCPDYLDKFPKHPECCGDSDGDGICDELDNCVLAYNPFQEDYDEDDIGDECDPSVFGGDGGGGGGGGGLGAYNCNPYDQLIALINQEPPLSSGDLKQIMMASSPLPPEVLNELIDTHPIMTDSHFRQVFVANVELPEDVYDNVMDMDNLGGFHKAIISIAHWAAGWIPWLFAEPDDSANYSITLFSDAEEPETWNNRILFYDGDPPLGEDGKERTDVFFIDVENATGTIIVTTTSSLGSAVTTLAGEDLYFIDDLGFAVELNDQAGDFHALTISSVYTEAPLDSVEFDFGSGANIVSPVGNYTADRYVCYCEGGCAENCGDIGTGIITTNVYTDRCYRWDWFFPEWCSHWYTFEDDDTENPAFMGGTQEGEETTYWEKTFKTVLTQLQLENLQSITVGAEIAYQSITQFFCDTLSASCPMDGNLVSAQDIELYDWDAETWEIVGAPNVDGGISDQQAYEVIYDNSEDVLRFIGGEGGRIIKARMKFNWNGVIPPEEDSAPCFMLIDYFTLHLKW